MPSRGAGPQPKQSAPPRTTCSAAPASMAAEGPTMLPEPRSTEASMLLSQIAPAKEKTTAE